MASSIHPTTSSLIRRLHEATYSTPRDLHERVAQLVTSFFRDDRFVPGLLAFGIPNGAIGSKLLSGKEMSVPGELMAEQVRAMAEMNHAAAAAIAMPSTRFEIGKEMPATPNFYRLWTLSDSEAPIQSSWRIRMKDSGRCLKSMPVAAEDNTVEGEMIIAAHWAMVFPECPAVPEIIQGRGAYYRATYVEPEGAVHDPAFRSY